MTEDAAKHEGERTPSILMVDDIPANLRILYESLKGRDYRLLIANSGAQALEVAKRASPDLILLDIMMPDMDGFEVCRRLKADPETKDSAVIFLSALDDAADKIRGLELGAVDYVSKPFNPDEVAARVDTHCKILLLERELANRNRQLELVRDRILNSMAEGVVGVDADARVRFVNPAAERILGADAQHLLGRRLEDWEPEQLKRAITRALAERREIVVDGLSLPRAGREHLPADLRVAPVCASDRLEGAVVVLRDLSDRRRVEAKLDRTSDELRQSHRELKEAQMQLIQAAKLESVGRLAAGVAHEVKNPLAIVQLGLDYLAQVVELDGTSSEVVNDMQHAISRADTVVRGLVDFSRERDLDLKPYSMNRILADSLQLVRYELVQRQIAVETALSETVPSRMYDPDKMQQGFLNLFMNAMHAMDRVGTLTVATETIVVAQDDLGTHAKQVGFLPGDRLIRVRVEDTGPGIQPQDLERLFDPYFTTKRQGEGSGLGLSVTRNIVTLHGGSIDLENRPGGGARAVLLFRPAQDSAKERDEPKEDPAGR
jgi:PAS domain S-box-containing protein